MKVLEIPNLRSQGPQSLPVATWTKQNLQAARENDPEAVTTAQQMGHSSIRFMRDSCGIDAGFVLVVLRATAVRPPGPKTVLVSATIEG